MRIEYARLRLAFRMAVKDSLRYDVCATKRSCGKKTKANCMREQERYYLESTGEILSPIGCLPKKKG